VVVGQQRLQPGQVFAGYRIERLLGAGGMGAVYLARHPNLPKLVALKLLSRVTADHDEVRARFLREADHVARLDHPNIVAVYDRGDQDGQLWIAMQYIDGSDAAAAVREGPLAPARAVRIVAETAKALDFAHAADVLHRDVKPANILLTRATAGEPERVLLADFGIAKALDDRTGITATGMFTGSLQYASPEQLNAVALDGRADEYSLGCTLYHLLTGSVPYPGNTPEQWMRGHLFQPVPLLSQSPAARQARIPAGMDAVVQRALAKDRDQRYPSCAALAAAAQHELDMADMADMTDPTDPTDPTWAATIRARPPGNVPTQLRPRSSPSKRTWLIASLVVALIAAVGIGVVLFRNFLAPKGAGAELVLTGATDPGANPFMPPAASPPPTNTQPAPTLQPHGGATVATQPLPGDREGLYGGTLDNAACDRDKMIAFLGSHPAQAGAFVAALNTDPTLSWSGGHALSAADIPTYLRELTPVLLRLDTRVTNHGFDGTRPTTLQSVFQAGTGVFVDAHGVPRARCYCGNPLTAPIAMTADPKAVGAAWSGYRPGALAAVQPSTAAITVFVLVDVVTGQGFNRPAGTTGANDTVRTQPVPPPQPAPAAPSTGQGPQASIDGTYLLHYLTKTCGPLNPDQTATITHQGNSLTLASPSGNTFTGTLNSDGSFSVSYDDVTMRGVFVTKGGRTVIRDGTWQHPACGGTFEGTKQ
jgi:serine/threonine protein kinase